MLFEGYIRLQPVDLKPSLAKTCMYYVLAVNLGVRVNVVFARDCQLQNPRFGDGEMACLQNTCSRGSIQIEDCLILKQI